MAARPSSGARRSGGTGAALPAGKRPPTNWQWYRDFGRFLLLVFVVLSGITFVAPDTFVAPLRTVLATPTATMRPTPVQPGVTPIAPASAAPLPVLDGPDLGSMSLEDYGPRAGIWLLTPPRVTWLQRFAFGLLIILLGDIMYQWIIVRTTTYTHRLRRR